MHAHELTTGADVCRAHRRRWRPVAVVQCARLNGERAAHTPEVRSGGAASTVGRGTDRGTDRGVDRGAECLERTHHGSRRARTSRRARCGERRAQRVHLLLRIPCRTHRGRDPRLQRALSCEVVRRGARTRIVPHRDLLRARDAIGGQSQCVGPRECEGPLRRRRCAAGIRVDLERMREGRRRVVPQVPVHAMRAGARRERARRLDPEVRVRRPRRLRHRRDRVAREVPHHRAGRIEHVQRDAIGGRAEPVVDDGAVERVLRVRDLRRERRVVVHVAPNARRHARREEMHRGRRDRRRGTAQLPQHGDVVDHPEPASVRGDEQVVVLDEQIAHRTVGQVVRERLPVLPIVERDMDAAFGAGEEQPLRARVLAHHASEAATRLVGRQTIHDPGP